jgi:hypothetical protein
MANLRYVIRQQVLSDADREWLRKPCIAQLQRMTAMMNVLSSVPNPDDPEEMLHDEACRDAPMPQTHLVLIVNELERRYGADFFWMEDKAAFVAGFIICVVRMGNPLYGKPPGPDLRVTQIGGTNE